MGSLSQAKTLGGIGAILTLLLFVPYYVGGALVIIGWILILWAVKNISDSVQDRSIYTNAMISAVLAIIGTIVFAVVVVGAVLGFIGLGNVSMTTTPAVSGGLLALITEVILGLAVVWILGVVSSFFLWKSFKTAGVKLNVGLFGTASLIYFIGSILTIVLVGFILTFIAQILFIVAFFSIPDKVQTPMMSGPTMGTQ